MQAMPNAFDFSVSPFHSLTPTEQDLVRTSVDIAYFQAQEVIIETGAAPSALYFIIKGQVAQMEGSNTVHIYGPQDSFDGRALMAGRSSHRFVAREEVLATSSTNTRSRPSSQATPPSAPCCLPAWARNSRPFPSRTFFTRCSR